MSPSLLKKGKKHIVEKLCDNAITTGFFRDYRSTGKHPSIRPKCETNILLLESEWNEKYEA